MVEKLTRMDQRVKTRVRVRGSECWNMITIN